MIAECAETQAATIDRLRAELATVRADRDKTVERLASVLTELYGANCAWSDAQAKLHDRTTALSDAIGMDDPSGVTWDECLAVVTGRAATSIADRSESNARDRLEFAERVDDLALSLGLERATWADCIDAVGRLRRSVTGLHDDLRDDELAEVLGIAHKSPTWAECIDVTAGRVRSLAASRAALRSAEVTIAGLKTGAPYRADRTKELADVLALPHYSPSWADCIAGVRACVKSVGASRVAQRSAEVTLSCASGELAEALALDHVPDWSDMLDIVMETRHALEADESSIAGLRANLAKSRAPDPTIACAVGSRARLAKPGPGAEAWIGTVTSAVGTMVCLTWDHGSLWTGLVCSLEVVTAAPAPILDRTDTHRRLRRTQGFGL